MSASQQQLVSDSLLDFMDSESLMMDAITLSTLLQFCRFKAYFEFEHAQDSMPLALSIPQSLVISPIYNEVLSVAGSSPKSPGNDRVVDDDCDVQENDLL